MQKKNIRRFYYFCGNWVSLNYKNTEYNKHKNNIEMKNVYVSPEVEVIDMMVDGAILNSSEPKLNINSDETVTGSNSLSSHRSFPWSEEEE